MEAGAFGAGKAGTAFNPVEFVQRPQVILRLLNIVSFLSTVAPSLSIPSHHSGDVDATWTLIYAAWHRLFFLFS